MADLPHLYQPTCEPRTTPIVWVRHVCASCRQGFDVDARKDDGRVPTHRSRFKHAATDEAGFCVGSRAKPFVSA